MSTASIAFDILARDKASDKFDKVGRSADRTSSKFSKMGSALKTSAKVGMFALAGGAVIAGKALYDMAKGAAEDQAGQVRLAKALQNSAGATKGQVSATESWISKQGVALGVTDDELRPALGRLVTATHDVGKAQKLASLAMDVSAGTGKSLATVSEALMKAQNGNTAGLGRLGIATKDASGKTLTMTQLTKNLADTFGGQAAAKANTFQGKMDRLKLVFDETKETIGAKMLPMLTKLGTWFLNKGIPAISKMWSWLGQKLGPVFKTIGNFISGSVVPAVQKMVGQFSSASGKTGMLKKAFADLKPFLSLVGAILKNVVGPALKWVASVVIPLVIFQFRSTAKILGVVGKAGIALWNSALAPTFRFILRGVGTMMVAWGKLLHALGKVPGFEWAKRAGDQMDSAGRKAVGMANNIKKIPTSHNTRATFDYANASDAAWRLRSIYAGIPRTITTQAITRHIDKFDRVAARASGGPVRAGTPYLVGEQGPELIVPTASGMVVNADGTQRLGQGGSRGLATSGGGGGAQIVEVHMHLDGKTIVQQVLAHKRGQGGKSTGIG